VSEGRPDLADAAFAVAGAAVDVARLPLALAARLPGVRLLARDGAFVRARLRSRAEGLLARALEAPETARAIDRALAGALPDALARSVVEHDVLSRLATRMDVNAPVDQEAPERVVREDEPTAPGGVT
jgi:hypothetical protein